MTLVVYHVQSHPAVWGMNERDARPNDTDCLTTIQVGDQQAIQVTCMFSLYETSQLALFEIDLECFSDPRAFM